MGPRGNDDYHFFIVEKSKVEPRKSNRNQGWNPLAGTRQCSLDGNVKHSKKITSFP